MNLPLPNNTLDDSLVIASKYHTDQIGDILLLNCAAPFYQRILLDLLTGTTIQEETYENIAEATEDWQ